VLGTADWEVAASLDEFVKLPLARGIRAASLNFSDGNSFETIVNHTKILADRRLSLDIITAVQSPDTSQAIARLAAAVPSATLILNHLGSPSAHNSSLQAWTSAMTEIAKHQNVFVKVGGLLQYFKGGDSLPSIEQLRPLVLTALQLFGFSRSMFESNWFFINWPNQMHVYEFWLSALHHILQNSSLEELEHLFFRSSGRAYRIQHS
jgi:predicted TIM-barrel fold metal-dependent hydrolase